MNRCTAHRELSVLPHVLEPVELKALLNEVYGVDDFAPEYIGYCVCNNAVTMQKFGDRHADDNAKAILAEALPKGIIEQISIDGIVSSGGRIHCAA